MNSKSKRQKSLLQYELADAREIQQNLLPLEVPKVKGLEIAGRTVYRAAMGGDYFDYMDFEGVCCSDEKHITIVVGDVSGHDFSSALLMASVRSLLRSRIMHQGDLGNVLTDVNWLLARDTANTGQFVTMFLMDINPGDRKVKWIRAGHDPAMVYIPDTDRFEYLNGDGVAVGVCEKAEYKMSVRAIGSGHILLIASDGIKETLGPRGEMFGTERLKKLVRNNSRNPAHEILDSIMDSVNLFRGHMPQQDDVTLVVAKLL